MLRRIKAIVKLARRFALPLALGVVFSLVGIWLTGRDELRGYEFEAVQRLQRKFTPVAMNPDIVVIISDKRDGAKLDHSETGILSRVHHADLINLLDERGASAVAFDLHFDAAHPAEDPALVHAIRNVKKLRIAFGVKGALLPGSKDSDRNGEKDTFPLPAFLPKDLVHKVGLGAINGTLTGPMFGDAPMFLQDFGRTDHREMPCLALVAYCGYYGYEPREVSFDAANYRASVGPEQFDLNRDADFAVQWPPANEEFKVWSYAEALSVLRSGDPNHDFDHKVVLVGNDSDETFPTVNGPKIGTLIQAHLLDTLFQKGVTRITWSRPEVDQGWIVVLSFVASLAVASSRRWVLLFGGVGAPVLALIVPIVLVISLHFLLGVVPALVASIGATMAALALKSAFPDSFPVPPGGMGEATVLFADVKDSTPLMERLGPEAGGAALQSALRVIRSSITAERGLVARESGDGVFAVFERTDLLSHSTAAIRASQRVIQALDKLEREAGYRFEFTFGIESGMVFNTGKERHGLTIHIAARLQGACGAIGETLLIGPTAFGLAQHEFSFVSLEELQLKGISRSMKVYTLSETRT